MVNLEQWLMLLALISLALGGCQLNSWQVGRERILGGGVISLVVALTISLSDFLAAQSVIALQQQLATHAEVLSVVVLLEALLVCCAMTRYKLPLVSTFGAIIYGQMLFYQAGWLPWSFLAQGAVYGTGVAALIIFFWLLSHRQRLFGRGAMVGVVIISWTQLGQLPPPRQFEIPTDVQALVVCIAGFVSLIALGALYTFAKNWLMTKR